MFINNDRARDIIKGVLEEEGVDNVDGVVLRIMDELTTYQRSIAKEGSVKGGRPKKNINFDTVQKHLRAGVPFTAIAASQKVSEGTLRRRMKKEGVNP